MSYFRRLARAHQLAQQLQRFDEMAESDWTLDDAMALKTFMVGVSGSKLSKRLNNFVFKSAVEACQIEQNGDYHRGIARGILLAVHSIDNHFPPAPEVNGANSEVMTE